MTTTDMEWLEAAGVSAETCSKISHLSLKHMRKLMIADYERFGITDMAQKQRLFRALQGSAPGVQPTGSPPLTPQVSGPSDGDDALVDLEGEDEDFFTQVWCHLCAGGPVSVSCSTAHAPSCSWPCPQDLDLDAFPDPAFMLSPAPSASATGAAQPAPGQSATGGSRFERCSAAHGPAGGPNSGGAVLLDTLPDAPKIRVIVRKRPLNKKVRGPACSGLLRASWPPQAPIDVALPSPPAPWQEMERGESDVLECDTAASCLYVNEPKVKVDLTKYTERHTFRRARAAMAWRMVLVGLSGACHQPRNAVHGPLQV